MGALSDLTEKMPKKIARPQIPKIDNFEIRNRCQITTFEGGHEFDRKNKKFRPFSESAIVCPCERLLAKVESGF